MRNALRYFVLSLALALCLAVTLQSPHVMAQGLPCNPSSPLGALGCAAQGLQRNAAPDQTQSQPTQPQLASVQTSLDRNPPQTRCDILTAFAFDPQRKAPGVTYSALNAQQGVPQCTADTALYPNSGRLSFELGRALEKANRIAEAITAYRHAADLGHGGGFNNLGELYRDGKGIPRDISQARLQFEKGAAQGYAEAKFNLANLLVGQARTSANVERARQLLTDASNAGYTDALKPLQNLSAPIDDVTAQPRSSSAPQIAPVQAPTPQPTAQRTPSATAQSDPSLSKAPQQDDEPIESAPPAKIAASDSSPTHRGGPFARAGQSSSAVQTTNDGKKIQTVIGDGMGSNIESALQNAAENALKNVVGSFVTSDKMAERYTQISDGVKSETKKLSSKTHEYSQGSIQSIDIVESKQDGAIFRVTAKVSVRIADFRQYITKAVEGDAKVSRGLFADFLENKVKNIVGYIKVDDTCYNGKRKVTSCERNYMREEEIITAGLAL